MQWNVRIGVRADLEYKVRVSSGCFDNHFCLWIYLFSIRLESVFSDKTHKCINRSYFLFLRSELDRFSLEKVKKGF
jgi:hypothetical protein